MAKLGKIDFTVVDQAGDIVANAIVEVRKQGAYVNGTQIISSPSGAVNVHSPGGIIKADAVAVDAGTTTYAVTADPTTTTVTVAVTEDTTFTDGERLTPVTNLPSIYSDADEVETAPPANPFTTGSDAKFCNYLRGNYYDMKITGSGLTDTLVPDRFVAAEHRESNAGRPAGNAILDILNSPVTLDASDKFVSYQFGDVEKFSIDGLGGFAAGAASSVAGILTVTLGVVVDAGGLTVTAGDGVFTAGDVTIALGDLNMGNTASQIVPGLTSFAIRNNADSADNLLVTDAGDVTVRNDLTVLGAASIGGNIDAVVDITASGDLSLSSKITYSAAVSQLVPGATSFAVRNNADSADNLLVEENGNVSALGNLKTSGSFIYRTVQTVESASPLVIGTGNHFKVSGSTNFNTITATDADISRLLVLQGDTGATCQALAVGGNLSIPSNFTFNVADTLTLIYDGQSWVQVTNSNN